MGTSNHIRSARILWTEGPSRSRGLQISHFGRLNRAGSGNPKLSKCPFPKQNVALSQVSTLQALLELPYHELLYLSRYPRPLPR